MPILKHSHSNRSSSSSSLSSSPSSPLLLSSFLYKMPLNSVKSLSLAVILVACLMVLPVTKSSSQSSSPHPSVEIKCAEKTMEVTVDLAKEERNVVIYLDKLKGYPGCHPEMIDNKAIFRLPLDDNFYSCGTTRIQNKLRDVRIFYNRVIIERPSNSSREIVIPKCVLRDDLAPHFSRFKRQSGDFNNNWDLPENFTESVEELIDYSGNITEHAPIPYLNIGVRQNGRFVDTALNVHPGTPLEMVIYLDETSAPVYGLLARYLKVTDNTPRKQEETIILEGCSVDPYIFSNFETTDGGDSIVAKFRAFKFPESNYVLFVGTVNVCLKECLGVVCGNNQLGFGRRRRRRSIATNQSPDPNKIFEIEMTAFLRIENMELEPSSVLKGSAKPGNEEEKVINRRDDLKHDAIAKDKYESRSLPLRDVISSKPRKVISSDNSGVRMMVPGQIFLGMSICFVTFFINSLRL